VRCVHIVAPNASFVLVVAFAVDDTSQLRGWSIDGQCSRLPNEYGTINCISFHVRSAHFLSRLGGETNCVECGMDREFSILRLII
jgi:hypothetical protein